MAYYSPLRYPGGKGKMLPQTIKILQDNGLVGCTYIEAFAGGSNLALNLLFKGYVSNIILNDADPAIYAMWYSILNFNDEFIEFIKTVPLDLDEHSKQKRIYENERNNLLMLGLATFYLNRTNRSGIIKAGPIGGYAQRGSYLLDCRFNRENLIKRIKDIYKYKDHIKIFGEDARSFFKKDFPENSFFFIDPPYYNKGACLYRNFFNHQDHLEISKIVKNLKYPWVVTYDNVDPILKMYSFSNHIEYDLSYTVETKRRGQEVMFYNDMIKIMLV